VAAAHRRVQHPEAEEDLERLLAAQAECRDVARTLVEQRREGPLDDAIDDALGCEVGAGIASTRS